MTQRELNPKQWAHLAMGPKLRAWLGISPSEYQGASNPERSPEDEHGFTEFIDRWASQELPDDEQSLIDLLDELVGMDMPEAVLRLCDRSKSLWTGQDFRGQLAVGIAAMLQGNLDLSEMHLLKAQALLPLEPAPYVNLAQIFLHQGRLKEATTWCLAGLDAELNNLRLWDLLAMTLKDQFGDYYPDQLMKHAKNRNSWAGLALAADVTPTADRFLKLRLLQGIFESGERDPQFLVELTAALGIAGEFEKIPPIVWQAEKASTKPLPWQLYAHAAQAHISLGKREEALAQLAKAKRDPNVDDYAQQALDELISHANEVEQNSDHVMH